MVWNVSSRSPFSFLNRLYICCLGWCDLCKCCVDKLYLARLINPESMWYEILPTLGIFSTFLLIPNFVPWVVHMAARGKPHRRTAMDPEDFKLTMRDERLTGHYFKMKGLDFIPDPK